VPIRADTQELQRCERFLLEAIHSRNNSALLLKRTAKTVLKGRFPTMRSKDKQIEVSGDDWLEGACAPGANDLWGGPRVKKVL